MVTRGVKKSRLPLDQDKHCGVERDQDGPILWLKWLKSCRSVKAATATRYEPIGGTNGANWLKSISEFQTVGGSYSTWDAAMKDLLCATNGAGGAR